jgi:hypothetical protein
MGAFVAPREQVALKVYLFKQSFIEEPVKLPHPSPVQAAIIFFLGLVHHVEVTT